MKKKLFLKELKVKSFVTTYSSKNQKTIKGGIPAVGGVDTEGAECGTYDCGDTYYCAGSGYAHCSGTCGGGGASDISVCACIDPVGASLNGNQGGGCLGNGTLRCGG